MQKKKEPDIPPCPHLLSLFLRCMQTTRSLHFAADYMQCEYSARSLAVGDRASLGFGLFRPRDGVGACQLDVSVSLCTHAFSSCPSLRLRRLAINVHFLILSIFRHILHRTSLLPTLGSPAQQPRAASRTANKVQAPFVQHLARAALYHV